MKRIVICIIPVVLAGCVVVAQPEPTSAFRDRLSNAEQIVDLTIRDRAYGRIAVDAAFANDTGAAIEATQGIVEIPVRDQTACDCAHIFDSQGNRSGADAEAEQVVELNVRDRLRADLAMHPTGHPPMATTLPMGATAK